MQAEQKALIKKYWNKLIHLTEVQALAKILVDKEIFTKTEIFNIFSTLDERDNNEIFFNHFLDKDELAFKLLVEWLIAIDNHELARKLAEQRPGITPYKEPDEDEEEDEITSSIEAEPVVFDDSKTPLRIKVQLADQLLDTKDHNPRIPFYSSRSEKRGRVLIINNYDFDDTNHKTRTGADIDRINLEQLFQQMGGWVVKSKTNLTAEQMRGALKSFSKEKREKRCDICFVFIMSHGSEKLNQTIIYGRDGQYLSTEDIQSYFTNEKCSLFRGKPKVFIYQVCRGNELDLPRTYNTEFDGKQNGHQNSATIKEPKPILGFFRPVDDMLIGYATMQGSKAHRDPYRGTWYIELICKHFMELAKFEPVDNLLLKVDEGLRKRMSEILTVQTAEHISKGFKKLYLNPGLYEENGRTKRFHTDEN